jgi:hypothetical protein
MVNAFLLFIVFRRKQCRCESVFVWPLQVTYRGAMHTMPEASRCFSAAAAQRFFTKGISQGKSYSATEKITAVSNRQKRLTRTIDCGSGHAEEATSQDAMACCLLSPRK